MTVSYQYDVASSTSGGFTRLLFKWKGSVYKLVWRELAWFMFAFAMLSLLYRLILTQDQKRIFERVVYYFDTFLSLIPLSFVLGVYVTLVVTRWWQQFLAIPWPDKFFEKVVVACDGVLNLIPLTFVTGFYVSFVATRWWQQYMALPWPDRIAHCLALYVSGNDEHSRVVRRTLARYLNLSLILVLRSISMAVKKRFPTLQHLVEGGFMTKTELEIYQSVPSSEFNTYWIPCTWFINLIKEARQGQLITDSQGLKLLVEEFNEFRSKCGLLWSFDWVSIPLVYTQVVTLATYSFFAACVIGRQYVELPDPVQNTFRVDLYVPISTILQFFFYMGLLKVAEALINPFGDDDEDFELNWMIDRHLKVCYLVVDTLLLRNPPLVKDQHYDDPEPTLAYTKAAMMYKKKTFRGSVAAVQVPEEDQTMFLPEILEEDEDNQEFSSDLSINKHASNSIMNLLAWTSSTGNRMLHSKKSLGDEHPPPEHHQHQQPHQPQLKTTRSMSVTEDVVAMDAAGGHLGQAPARPCSPRPKLMQAVSKPQTATTATFTSGIRRFFSTTVARSAESLPFTRVVTHHLPQAQRPNVATITSVKRDESFSARSDAGIVTIVDPSSCTSGGRHHQRAEVQNATYSEETMDAARLKSRSLDMGHSAIETSPSQSGHRTSAIYQNLSESQTAPVAALQLPLPAARNRSGSTSTVVKVRDLKRRRKKKSDPSKQRTWRSKESIPVEDDVEIRPATASHLVAVEQEQDNRQDHRDHDRLAALQAERMSWSLPSLHLWPVVSAVSNSSSACTVLQMEDDLQTVPVPALPTVCLPPAHGVPVHASLPATSVVDAIEDQEEDDFVDANAEPNQSPDQSRFLGSESGSGGGPADNGIGSATSRPPHPQTRQSLSGQVHPRSRSAAVLPAGATPQEPVQTRPKAGGRSTVTRSAVRGPMKAKEHRLV